MACTLVNLDFRCQASLAKSRAQSLYNLRFTLMIVFRYGYQKIRFHGGDQQMWAIRIVGRQATTVEGSSSTNALGQLSCCTHHDGSPHAPSVSIDVASIFQPKPQRERFVRKAWRDTVMSSKSRPFGG